MSQVILAIVLLIMIIAVMLLFCIIGFSGALLVFGGTGKKEKVESGVLQTQGAFEQQTH